MDWPFGEHARLKRDKKKAYAAVDREKAKLDKMMQTLPPNHPDVIKQQNVWGNAVAKRTTAATALSKWETDKLVNAALTPKK